MRFLIGECLHESLIGVAHAAGFEATHVNHLGLSSRPDSALAERIARWSSALNANDRVSSHDASAEVSGSPTFPPSHRERLAIQ
jgi:hypothetical protein